MLRRLVSSIPRIRQCGSQPMTLHNTPMSCLMPSQISSRFLSTEIASKDDIEKMVKADKIVVFMKGIPDQPQCGFSKAVVTVLKDYGVKFTAYNVLEDNAIREGVKNYTDWKTIPQIFFNGEFVGGCDILIEMYKNGELEKRISELSDTKGI